MAQIDTNGFAAKVTMQHETRRGIYWQADLTHNGMKVADVYNDGDGGPTYARWMQPNIDLRKQFEQYCKEMWPTSFEPVSEMLTFLSYIHDPECQSVLDKIANAAELPFEELNERFHKELSAS